MKLKVKADLHKAELVYPYRVKRIPDESVLADLLNRDLYAMVSSEVMAHYLRAGARVVFQGSKVVACFYIDLKGYPIIVGPHDSVIVNGPLYTFVTDFIAKEKGIHEMREPEYPVDYE